MTLRWILGSTIGLLLLISVIAYSQEPALDPLPQSSPIHFDCVATNPAGLTVKVDWDRNPFEALKMYIIAKSPVSADKVPPTITSVVYTGGPSVLTDAVKIPGNSTSVQFSVSATDDVGVQSFALYVDGFLASPGPPLNYPHFLPATFAIRWNDGTILTGPHAFRLAVYDQAGNSSEIKTWTMVK